MIARIVLRSPAASAGAMIVVFVSLVSLLSVEYVAPWDDGGARPRSFLTRHFLAHDPHLPDPGVAAPPSGPDARHWLGTDIQQRDLLARLLHGSKVSLTVGVAASAIALTLGLLVGALAGFYHGRIDAVLMRTADILLALPLPVLAMAAVAVFETRSLFLLFAVLGLMGWAWIARLVRARCLTVRGEGYPEAARALGAGDVRTLAVHIVPNVLGPAIVAAAVAVSGNILTEAWLAFLGLGAQHPAISWGRMIVDGQPFLVPRPWLSVLPGLALTVTVLGFVLLADGLRDLLDPKSRLATRF